MARVTTGTISFTVTLCDATILRLETMIRQDVTAGTFRGRVSRCETVVRVRTDRSIDRDHIAVLYFTQLLLYLRTIAETS